MVIGVLKEPHPETRVSLLPEHLPVIKKFNATLWVESGAGSNAFATDEKFTEAGAEIGSRENVIQRSSIILSIHPPANADLDLIKEGTILLGNYQPLYNTANVVNWLEKKLTVFSIDMIPRTTRAQSMDVLSSQANIAGYKAVLQAANLLPHYFPMFMTAAGTIAPAKVLILGAGVAGLQAIATAKRLGAVVEVFDTRPSVKEEVMSLGAKFIEVEGAADASKAGGYAVEQTEEYKQRQQEKIQQSVLKSDVVITTAQIPGRKAPVLITEETINKMKNGSVIIDLAASTGGNTAVTKNGEKIVHNGISIIGDSALPSSMPYDASKVYGKNILNFMQLIVSANGDINLNFNDDLVAGTYITHNGKILNEKVSVLVDKVADTA